MGAIFTGAVFFCMFLFHTNPKASVVDKPVFCYDMSMLWVLSFIIAGCVAGLVATTRSRTAELARLARANGCAFDKSKASVTTQLTAGRLEFFTQFFHQYHNVFTCSDNVAFIRWADDTIYSDENAKKKLQHITIFTAELKKRQFPLLKVAPLDSPFARSQQALMKTNIPAIDARYRMHAPSPASGLLLTSTIIGLFKTQPNIYLELNENALVYHEHCLIPVPEIESFRFRALQILGELEKLVEKMDLESTDTGSAAPPVIDASPDARAAAILQRFGGEGLAVPVNPPMWRGFWFLLLVLIFFGVSFLSWFALKNWVGQ